jgi:Domain of unknown function (DUF2382)
MPALDPETRERWRDLVVVDRESATVGTITAFFLDQASGRPTWALVHSGWLADRQTFVPLADAVEVEGEIRLPYTKHQVTEAPRIDPTGELSADDELVLAAHYGLHDHHGALIEGQTSVAADGLQPHPPSGGGLQPHPPSGGAPTGRVPAPGEERDRLSTAPAPAAPASAAPAPAAGVDSPGEPGGAGAVVTRSEEELRVGMRTRLRRLRVRRYVVTEYVTRTIPVRREKVRLEEIPSDQVVEGGADRWPPAGEAGTPELEVVLHREEPVVQLRAVPVERVRLVRRLVSDRRTLTAELRKEQVEVDEGPPAP